MKTVVKNANLVGRDGISFGSLLLEDGRISEVGRGAVEVTDPSVSVIDAKNRYVAPGFIDLHTHGAGGCDYMDGTVESIVTAAKTQMRYGVTTVLPTTLTSTAEELFSTIDNFRRARERMMDGPNMQGLHLEGPYFSLSQKGAQDPRFIRNPDPAEYKKIIEYADGAIARWSAAPELDGALEFGDYLTQHHILASIAHSNAEYRHVAEAYRHGYTHVTHLYSGMSTIVRRGGFRFLGVVESAYVIDGMNVEIIADGCHLPPELLRLVYQCKGPDKTCLVTDSMRGAGMPDGESILGSLKNGQRVIIEDGVAKMPDHVSFAGSVATADRLMRVMHSQAGVNLWDCVAMMSATPARVMGIFDKKGSLAEGKDADLVFFDDDISVSRVLIGGRTTYSED